MINLNNKASILLSILFCFLSINIGFGQNRDGYIITNSNDTIYGQVKNYSSNTRKAKNVKFTYASGHIERLTSDQIKGYGYGSNHYVSVKMKVTGFSLSVEALNSVFMKVIVAGRVKLLEHQYVQANYGVVGPNNLPSVQGEIQQVNYLGFPNGDKVLFDMKRIRSGKDIIFTDFPDILENMDEYYTASQLIGNYNHLLRSETHLPDSLNDPDKVNIVLFRRESPIDKSTGELKVKLNSIGSVSLKSGQYAKLTTNEVKSYRLIASKRPNVKKADLFARKSHVIYIEIAYGDIISIKAIDSFRASELLKTHEEVKPKLKRPKRPKRPKIAYKDWE